MRARTASGKPQPPNRENIAEAIEARAREELPEYYKRQANRFLHLASTSPYNEARTQFLLLAQYYEVLATHTQRRSAK